MVPIFIRPYIVPNTGARRTVLLVIPNRQSVNIASQMYNQPLLSVNIHPATLYFLLALASNASSTHPLDKHTIDVLKDWIPEANKKLREASPTAANAIAELFANKLGD